MEITGITDLEGVTADADLKRLYRYWAERCGERAFPSRDDIDPIEFDYALGRVSLIDVLEGPRRFYYRLVSTHLTRHLGYEMTGKFLDQLPESQVRDFAGRHYLRALEQRVPIYESGEVVLDRRRWRHESLVLPLSADGQTISMLMVYRVTDAPVRAAPDGG